MIFDLHSKFAVKLEVFSFARIIFCKQNNQKLSDYTFHVITKLCVLYCLCVFRCKFKRKCLCTPVHTVLRSSKQSVLAKNQRFANFHNFSLNLFIYVVNFEIQVINLLTMTNSDIWRFKDEEKKSAIFIFKCRKKWYF